jgi:ferredoxin
VQNFHDPTTRDRITVHYVNKDGTRTSLRGKIGNNVMHLAQQNGVEIEGACEASLACSTCHVYVKEDFYSKLPEAHEK